MSAEAMVGFLSYSSMQNTEEGVAIVQEAADRVWGSDCKRLMQIVTAQAFDRRHLFGLAVDWTQNVFHCHTCSEPSGKDGKCSGARGHCRPHLPVHVRSCARLATTRS
jgi:hypothetical protein